MLWERVIFKRQEFKNNFIFTSMKDGGSWEDGKKKRKNSQIKAINVWYFLENFLLMAGLGSNNGKSTMRV